MAHKFLQYLLHNQVIFALFLIVSGWFIWLMKDILISIFISYIITAALIPLVSFLRRRGLPKIAAVALAYFGVLTFIVLLIVPLVPFFAGQINVLLDRLPDYLNESGKTLGIHVDSSQVQTYISQELGNIGKNAIFVTTKVFGGLFSTLTVLIVSFYLLLDHDLLRKTFASFFQRESRERVLVTLRQIDDKLGAWLRGQVVLCFAIGFLSWIALTILNVPNAIPLALIAGVLEAVPTIGPILSAVPAIIVGLTISPTLALTLVVVYTLIQFAENNILVPKVMQHAVGLNPVAVILAITTGASLIGVSGALLAIPFVAFTMVVIDNLKNDNTL